MKLSPRQTVILVTTSFVATGGAYWAWQAYSVDPLAGIQTAQVTKGDIEVAVLATGTLRPVKLVAVGAQVSGRLTAMKVVVGQTVKKDDLIAEIDNLAQVNAVKTAEAFLNNVGAQLKEKQASLAYAKAEMAREQITLAEKATSRNTFETAQTLVQTTDFQIDALEAQIVVAQVAVETANINLGYTRILAPIDGTVLLVVTQEGQTVNAAQTTPTIVILGQVDQMSVRAEISEADVTKAKRIIAAMKEAEAQGKGAVSLDGRLIDYASIRQAEVLVKKAEQIAGA